MKATRKTINVQELRKRVNRMLEMKHIPKEGKCSLCLLLEEVLHDTGNYKGFGWNLPYELAKDVRVCDPQYWDRHYI